MSTKYDLCKRQIAKIYQALSEYEGIEKQHFVIPDGVECILEPEVRAVDVVGILA